MNPFSEQPELADSAQIAPWALVLAQLRQKTLYDHQPLWSELLRYHVELSQHLALEGLELLVDKQEGFACLRQQWLDESGKTVGLIRRQPLTYDLSILCIVLRECLEEFDISASGSRNLYLRSSQIHERFQVFSSDTTNQIKNLKRTQLQIEKAIDLGFLEVVSEDDPEPVYQVMRVIKARVTHAELEAFQQQQEAYAHSIQSEPH